MSWTPTTLYKVYANFNSTVPGFEHTVGMVFDFYFDNLPPTGHPLLSKLSYDPRPSEANHSGNKYRVQVNGQWKMVDVKPHIDVVTNPSLVGPVFDSRTATVHVPFGTWPV